MIATATLIVGVVRDVMAWPSYELEVLDLRPIPVVAGVVPGKHTTRKGWLTKDFQYPQSPYTCDIDARIWNARDGQPPDRCATWRGRSPGTSGAAIRRYADPFSVRHLFAILNGRAPSMLELPDRPAAYDDVGRLCALGHGAPRPRGAGARHPGLAVGPSRARRGVRHLRRSTRTRSRALPGRGRSRVPSRSPRRTFPRRNPSSPPPSARRAGNGRARARGLALRAQSGRRPREWRSARRRRAPAVAPTTRCPRPRRRYADGSACARSSAAAASAAGGRCRSPSRTGV